MNIFYKILSGEASVKEKESFYRTLEENPDLKAEALDQQNLWHLAGIKECEVAVDKKNAFFNEFWQRRSASKPTPWIVTFSKYAAIIVVAMLAGILIHNQLLRINEGEAQTYVYQSEKGSVSTIVLPDSSKVWMNSDSKLEITNKRGLITAKLTGEAYFDIKHDEEREFIVDVGLFKIKDLGTKFNVRAYPDDNIYRASLLEGDIDVMSAQNKALANIDPGQGIVFNKKKNKYWVTNIDVSIESAWTEGKFVFIDKTLTQMCCDLEKWYNVDFEIQDEVLANTKFTCVLKKTTTVNQVLKILRVTSDVEYQIIASRTGKDIVVIR